MGYVRKGAATKGASESLLTPKKPAIFAKSKSAANSRSDDSSSKQPSFKRFGRLGNSTATPPVTPDGSPLNGVTVITTKTSPPSSPPREGDSAAGSIISDLSASIVRRPPPKFRIADEQESAVSGPPKTPEKARNLSESCSAGDYKEATEAIYKSLFGLVEDACQQVMPTAVMPASEHGDVNTSMDTEPVSNKKKEARFIVPTWGVPPTHSDDEDSDDDDSLFQSLVTKKIPVANSRDESPKERGETHENFELVLDPDAMQQKEQKDKKRWWGKRNGKDQGEKQDVDHSSVIGPDTRKKTTAFVEPETLAHRSKYALGDLLVDDDNSLSMLNGEDLLGDEVVPDEEELPKEVTSQAVAAAAAVTTAAVVVGTTAELPKSSTTKTSTPPASPSRSALAIVNEATPPTPSPVEPSTPLPSVPEATVAAVPAEARSTQRVQSAPDAEKISSASSFMSLSNPFAGLVRIGSGGKDKKITVAAPPAPPKPIWKEAVDPITGRAYYYHRLTRKTTWTKPGEEEAGVEVTKRQFGTSVRKGGRAHMEVPLEIKKIGSLRDQFDEIARVADVSAEKQRKIEDGDYTSEKKEGILKKKFTQKDYSPEVWAKKKEIQRLLTKMSPPDAESVVNVIQQYDGREDELMDQLRDMADSSPFDEPIPTAQSYCSSEKSVDEGKYLNEMEEDCEPIVSSSRSLPVKQPVVISSTKPLSQPALEGPALEAPTSPSHLSRIRTSQSNVTGISTWTERTEQTAKAGNLMGTNVFETIAEEIRPADTSLSSNEDSYEESYLPSSARISRVTPRVSAQASRTRELRVEEFSSSRLGLRKERFNKKPLYSPPRSRKTRFEGSVRGPSPASMTSTYNEDREETETDTNASDSVSALSHSDAEFISRKEKFDKARRKVLESAISKKDWQTAAEVTDDFILYRGSAGSGSGGSAEYASIDTAFAEEWTQSEVDKFISENDWDAVAKYIAYMRDINASASKIPPRPPPNSTSKQQVPMQGYPVTQTKSVTSLSSSASSTNSAYHRKFGARSQLQHETLQSVSSWESEESEFSEYSSGSYDDALDIEPRSNRNFAC